MKAAREPRPSPPGERKAKPHSEPYSSERRAAAEEAGRSGPAPYANTDGQRPAPAREPDGPNAAGGERLPAPGPALAGAEVGRNARILAGRAAAPCGSGQRTARATASWGAPPPPRMVRPSGAGPGSCDAAAAAILFCGVGI